MPKMLIDLSTEDAQALKELAAAHGHKVKPFVEYLVRMQIGAVPEPSVSRAGFPRAENPRTETPKQEPKQEIPAPELPHSGADAETLPVTREIPAQNTPEKGIVDKKPAKVSPSRGAIVEARQDASNEEQPISRNVAEYTERIGNGIYSNGLHFTLNKFGRRTFHRTIEEAQELVK